MSSDSTGEIYMITKTDGSGVKDVRQIANGGSGSGGSAPAPTESTGAGSGMLHGYNWAAGVAVVGGLLPMV